MKPDPTVMELYQSHRAALIAYAAPIVGCQAHAEDVVQEAFVRYSARREQMHTAAGANEVQHGPIVSSVSYLYRIVRNLALDWVQRSAASSEAHTSEIERLSAPAATPEQTLLQRDQLRVLAEALAELPERTRLAFHMHRLEGRSLQEIAEHLDISVVRAHQLVKDALRHGAVRLEAQE